MNTFSHVPPGFRFHPTDEELVDYYLRKKVASKRIDLDVIKDVDLYKIEPWDLQELCRLGTEEQNEWYFFSHKDKKYPTGTRTNRATKAGFWKATGRDKAIYSRHSLIGMRKTLVFYKGRAPNGQKSDWIMHEYRLETNENGTPQEEGWVVCRVFKKRMAAVRKMGDYETSPSHWYEDQLSFMASELDASPRRIIPHHHHQPPYGINASNYPLLSPNLPCKQELELAAAHYNHHHHHHNQHHLVHHHHHEPLFLQLPQLESPKIQQSNNNCNSLPYGSSSTNNNGSNHTNLQSSNLTHEDQGQPNFSCLYMNTSNEQAVDQVTDWRVLDKFVASQLSNENASASAQNNSKEAAGNDNNYKNNATYQNEEEVNLFESERRRVSDQMAQEYAAASASASASTSSSCQIDLWK